MAAPRKRLQQESPESTSKRPSNEPVDPHDLIRHYYADLCSTLDSSPASLDSLTQKMYSGKEIIDQGTLSSVSAKGGQSGARILFDYVEQIIKQSPEKLEDVLKIMEEVQILQTIVEKMRQHPVTCKISYIH